MGRELQSFGYIMENEGGYGKGNGVCEERRGAVVTLTIDVVRSRLVLFILEIMGIYVFVW